MAHCIRLWRDSVEVQGSCPAWSDVCHWSCAYTVLQTVQRPGMYSAVYGTMKNPRNHSIRVGHSLDFGHSYVAILP